MEEFQKRVAAVTMKNRVASFVILMLITAFFAVGIQRVDIRTIFRSVSQEPSLRRDIQRPSQFREPSYSGYDGEGQKRRYL